MANPFSHKKIYPSTTLGERLKNLRKRKHLTLDQAEEETKVRRRYLEALESGDYTKLPADVYTQGFLVKYGHFLGVSGEELINDFKRERGSFDQQRFLLVKNTSSERKIILTPRLVWLGLIVIAFIGLVGYIYYAVSNFTSPPNLEISSPVAETIIHEDSVEVVGKTDGGSTVEINNQVIFIDKNGNFREQVKLSPGLNNIEVRATNRIKKENVKEIKILAEF